MRRQHSKGQEQRRVLVRSRLIRCPQPCVRVESVCHSSVAAAPPALSFDAIHGTLWQVRDALAYVHLLSSTGCYSKSKLEASEAKRNHAAAGRPARTASLPERTPVPEECMACPARRPCRAAQHRSPQRQTDRALLPGCCMARQRLGWAMQPKWQPDSSAAAA
jgi:hypothetical protein